LLAEHPAHSRDFRSAISSFARELQEPLVDQLLPEGSLYRAAMVQEVPSGHSQGWLMRGGKTQAGLRGHFSIPVSPRDPPGTGNLRAGGWGGGFRVWFVENRKLLLPEMLVLLLTHQNKTPTSRGPSRISAEQV
jgi:hypothetical protein